MDCPSCNRFGGWDYHLNGSASCTFCGTLTHGATGFFFENNFLHPFQLVSMLQQSQTYTRKKRFRKYLQRVSRTQVMTSIPNKTWKYLLEHRPYHGPKDILATLKKAPLQRKCYDSLPMMTHHLCPNVFVPTLTRKEKEKGLYMFDIIDQSYPKKGSFISYVYILEFILIRLGRSDMLPFVSRIQCPKRRTDYANQLDDIFKKLISNTTKSSSLQVICDT